MSDDELFEELEELVKLSDPDNARFESTMKERDELWNKVTKDIRDNLVHFLIVYTNILVDKGLVDKSSKDVLANRILANIHYQVMEDLAKVFNTKENK